MHLTQSDPDSCHHRAFSYNHQHPENDPLEQLAHKHHLNPTVPTTCNIQKHPNSEPRNRHSLLENWNQTNKVKVLSRIRQRLHICRIPHNYQRPKRTETVNWVRTERPPADHRDWTPRTNMATQRKKICPNCDSQDIESEEHFLISCKKYEHLRVEFFAKIQDRKPNFNKLDNQGKFLEKREKTWKWRYNMSQHVITSETPELCQKYFKLPFLTTFSILLLQSKYHHYTTTVHLCTVAVRFFFNLI